MKRSLLWMLLLGLLLSLSVFACSDDAGDDDDDDTATDGDTDDDDDVTDGDDADDDDDDDDTDMDGDSDGDDETTDDDDDDDDVDGDTFSLETYCETHDCNPACDEGHPLALVTGLVQNENGEPMPNIIVTLCLEKPDGTASCQPCGTTDATGRMMAAPPASARCVDFASWRVVSYNEALDRVDRVIVSAEVDTTLGAAQELPEAIVLPVVPDCTRTPLGTASEPHTVTASDDTTLELIPADFSALGGTYDQLNLLPWNAEAWGWPAFLDSQNPPDGLVAFLPENTIETAGGAMIRFPNSKDYEAGTVVDLYGLGGTDTRDAAGIKVAEGVWARIGSATVSADGQWVESDAGSGLTFTTWAGWKKP